MIVLGGMGSITGSVLGALVVTFLPELLRQLPGGVYNYRLVIYALLLIIIMITRPQGMLGGREFGLSWLKRSRRLPEGTAAVGASQGVPVAGAAARAEKDVENR